MSPAFPNTSFTRISDVDRQALNAYLMAQPAVAADVLRPSLALLFTRAFIAA